MNPEQPINHARATEAKHLRMIITAGLVLVLVGIVFAYIYYGMQLAKQADPSIVVEESTPISDDERTRAILEALERATSTPTADMEEMMQALESAPAEPTADREEMLRALGYPGVSGE